MNKFDRIISTLVLLQTKSIIKAHTIAERFDISLRTVYRDINTLKNAGIPIIGDPGIGYSIMDGYRLSPIMFNEGEATALLTAEKFIGKMTDQETQNYYSSAMMKIKAILRSSEKQALAILDDSIVIADFKEWENKTYIQDLFKSIASKNVVSIAYQKADGTNSTRELEPIGCFHQATNWYLVAFCRLKKDYRTFKLKRISNLKVLDHQFETQRISLKSYIDKQKKAWKNTQSVQTIEVAFNRSHLKFAENRKYYFGFVDQTEFEDSVHMTFLNGSIEVFSRWLMQFGNQATVISPPLLKERIKTLSQELYHHYN